MKIWKYSLVFPTGNVAIPAGGKILDLQQQRGVPCLWVLVNPEAEKELRTFTVYGTGHEIPDEGFEYVGTYQEGMLVWHLFEYIGADEV